ncbi:MAG: mechanosensitive ion channel family protein [Desulfobacterales bacterium]|nr:mechanosensitive ion channel family protein [Desulfobacterales bacterium]
MASLHKFNYDMSQFFEPQKLVILIRLLVLLFIGLPTIYVISRWLRKYFSKKFSAQQAMILSKMVLYTGFIIIIFSILNELGFKLTHLLGAAGIIGIAVGFASQTSVSNIICGLFLITEKPFEVDDIITVQNNTGIVLSIDILSVKLRTFDNKLIRIPNETIIKSDVTNVTYFPIRRVDLNIGVAYKEDIGRIREVLLDVAHRNPLCLNEPEPLVVFSGFGNSSIDLLLLAWAVKTDWLKLKNSITEEIKKRFDEEGIEIPFPHLSLYSGSATQPIPINIVQEKSSTSK